jgi:hypothetical protein
MSKFFAAVLVFASMVSSAFAQGGSADVGLVNAMQGDVSYQGKDGPAKKAQAYMRLRHGDKINLGSGASIKISYTTMSRQETWTGPATFVATSTGGEFLKGNKPEIAQLPAAVPQKLARVAELMNTSRVGGLVVRSVAVQSPTSKEEVAEAVRTYEQMRLTAAANDVTPELLLYSVFEEHGMVSDLKKVAGDMLKRQPDNADIQRLAKAAMAAQ